MYKLISSVRKGRTTFSTADQVWGHTPEQRVAASTLRRYYFALRLAIAQAEVGPFISVSLKKPPLTHTAKHEGVLSDQTESDCQL